MAQFSLTVQIVITSDSDLTTASAQIDACRTIKEALDTLDWPDLDFDSVDGVVVQNVEEVTP
jgi:hypothetical protein